MRLDGKNVLVIGVGPGLGSATAYMLLKDGASVIISARTEDKLKLIKESLSKYGKIDYVVGDASTQAGSRKIIDDARKKAGRIDHLALLAGNYVDSPIENLTEDQVDAMVNANLKSPIYALNAALKDLKQGSSVVMVSSVFGTYATSTGNVAYSATKAGVAKAVEVLASDLSARGIRVNAVAPRAMDHDFAPERDWRQKRKLGGKSCPPEDVARVVVWLLTDESDWVDGAVIPVDGGSRR